MSKQTKKQIKENQDRWDAIRALREPKKGYFDNATRFDGMQIKVKPTDGYPAKPEELSVCPVCQGYGGWILILNDYGLGQHTTGFCSQCNGFGWVKEEDRVCIHAMKSISDKEYIAIREAKGFFHTTMFSHDHAYKCEKCGKTVCYDSSD